MNVFCSNSHGKAILSLISQKRKVPVFNKKSPYFYLVNKNKKHNIYNWSKLKLIEITDINNNPILIEKKTYKQYRKLKRIIKKELDIDIGIKYALRNYDEQYKIYMDFCQKYGKEYADKVVCKVGCSEHHTGLCIDLEIKVNNIWVSNNEHPETTYSILEMIHPYLSNYGFILRYPGAEYHKTYTEMPYEPWHIRYINSKKVAKYIEECDITFEEFYYLNIV